MSRRSFIFVIFGSLASFAWFSKIGEVFSNHVLGRPESLIQLVPLKYAKSVTYIYFFGRENLQLFKDSISLISDPRVEMVREWEKSEKLTKSSRLYSDRYITVYEFKNSNDFNAFFSEFVNIKTSIPTECNSNQIKLKTVIS